MRWSSTVADAGPPAQNTAAPGAQLQQLRTANQQVSNLQSKINSESWPNSGPEDSPHAGHGVPEQPEPRSPLTAADLRNTTHSYAAFAGQRSPTTARKHAADSGLARVDLADERAI
jgi:hypothetical protein